MALIAMAYHERCNNNRWVGDGVGAPAFHVMWGGGRSGDGDIYCVVPKGASAMRAGIG